MRWDNLFDDLESQLEQEHNADEIDVRAEEERLRLGRMAMRDRLVALRETGVPGGGGVRMLLTCGTAIAVRPVTFGRDWISGDLVEESARRSQCIVPIASIAALLLDRLQVADSIQDEEQADEANGLSRRLGLGFVLRDLCRRRASVGLQLADGLVHGTIDRVGRDHLDLAAHEPGSQRRESQVTQYRVVPFSQLQLVRL
jgi:hypothetical protein